LEITSSTLDELKLKIKSCFKLGPKPLFVCHRQLQPFTCT